MREFLIVVLCCFWTLCRAEASSERRYDVSSEKLWDALVKSIAIDLSYEIIQKDKDVGYLLFKKPNELSEKPFSAEIIKGSENGDKPRVRISLISRPMYEEVMVLDRLTARIREDRSPSN